jgi:hypothetical protein
MAEQGRQMSPAHDFAGPDDSDAQFMVVFVTHTNVAPTESEGIGFDHGLGRLFNSKDFASDLRSHSRDEFRGFGKELAMFPSAAVKERTRKQQGTP